MGYTRKALEKVGLHAVLTTCLGFSSVLDGACVACCLLCQQAATMSAYEFTSRAVASPDAPQKPLVRKRARSGGAKWVQVSRRTSASPAKRPRTTGSQQPACTHFGLRIIRGPSSIAPSSALSNLQLRLLKNVTIYPPPPTHTFLKRPFLTDFKKYTHTPPPPQRDEILAHWTKSSENPGKMPKPTVLAHTDYPREKCEVGMAAHMCV